MGMDVIGGETGRMSGGYDAFREDRVRWVSFGGFC